jgi:hypothetical protein
MNLYEPSRDREGAVSERGFALLLIFVLAASVALMLYTQMPRVAFESERDKEQLLIDRGEQYKRAIQLFYQDNRRYPGRIEDLENTNNHRYLRRRYLDPYTGKDEWRLIHTNGMFLTDSLVQKPPANPANSSGTTQGQTLTAVPIGPAGTTGAQTPNPAQNPTQTNPSKPTDPNVPQQVNAAVLTRPSDRPITPTGGFPPAFQQPVQQANSGYIDPASYPPITLFPNGYNPPAQQAGQQPGFQPGGQFQPGVQPGQFQPGIQPGGQFQPGVQPGFQPGVQQPGFQPGVQPGFQPGVQPGFQQGIQPGFQPGGVQPGFPQPTPFPQGQFQPGTLPGQIQQGQIQQDQLQPGGLQQQPFPVNQFPNPTDPNANQATPQFPGQQNGLPGVQGGIVPGLNPNFANQFPQTANPVAPNPIVPTPVPFTPPAPVQQPQFPVPPQQANNPSAPGAAPAPPNQALNMINQILTTPRQPPPGIGPATNTQQAVGGGIAGVASTNTGPTIKSYADKTKFEEWEFVFQLQQQGVPGQGANPLQNGGANGIVPPGLAPGQNGPGATNPGQIVNPATQQTPNPGGLPPLPPQ